jgi:hypothetical protein
VPLGGYRIYFWSWFVVLIEERTEQLICGVEMWRFGPKYQEEKMGGV